jgi:DNA-binding LacI/PurR family transcriptional regulator
VAKKRVTSADVARLSGVSQATVSYVMNDDPRQSISPETKQRVLEVAAALGYEPSAAARTLRSGTSRLVLVVLQFEQVDPNIALTLNALGRELTSHGYTLVWHVGRLGALREPHPSATLTPAVVLTFGDTLPQTERFLARFGVPIVSLGTGEGRGRVGALQVGYLFERGLRQLVFVAPERPDLQGFALSHGEGVRAACAERGLEPPRFLTLPMAREGAREALKGFLEVHPRPLGLCCYNDEVAFAALAGLADHRVRVPEDVAVIGCDDIPLAQLAQPPLTTVAFAGEASRALVLENILAAARDGAVQPAADVPPAVVVRGSA